MRTGSLVPYVVHARLRRLFMCIWLSALLCLGACQADSDSRPVPPFDVDFSPLTSNANLEFDVRILEKKSYSVQIYFDFDYSDREGAERARILLGVRLPTDEYSAEKPGVPAAFEVKVRRSNADKPLLVETVDHPNSNASGSGRYVTLTRANLEPGEYKVSVRVLSAAAELSKLRTMAGIIPNDAN